MGTRKEGFPCMNCGCSVGADEGRLFAEVFVCNSCYIMAESLYMKLQGELNSLLFILKDRIREHLVQGKFHYDKPTSLDQLSKHDMLTALRILKEGTK